MILVYNITPVLTITVKSFMICIKLAYLNTVHTLRGVIDFHYRSKYFTNNLRKKFLKLRPYNISCVFYHFSSDMDLDITGLALKIIRTKTLINTHITEEVSVRF